MYEIIFVQLYVPDCVTYFCEEFDDSIDALHVHLHPSLQSIENILDSSVT